MATARHMSTAGVTRFQRDVLIKQDANGRGGALIARRGVARNEYVELFDDFFGDVGQTINRPWVYGEVGTNSTGDFVSAVGDGVLRLLHSSDSEAQHGRIDFGDTLMVNMSKHPRMEVRAKVDFAGATFSADQRFVIGFASAFNATLDSVVTNAWFKLEGANLNILAESDDGTTDDDDNDTTVDLVDNTWTVFEIDVVSLTQVEFRVNGVLCQTLSLAALAADTWVQPLIIIQRDAGTEQEKLDIDYAHLTWERS